MHAKGDVIVCIDSDVTVPDTELLRKVERIFSEEPKVSCLAFRVFLPDGESDDVARWWHPLPIRKYAGTVFASDYFSGTAVAFRKKDMVDAGMFPELYRIQYEEVELSYRLLDNGKTIQYRPELSVLHHANQVGRGRSITYFKPRNQILLAFRVYDKPRALWHLLPRVPVGFLRAVASGYVSGYFEAIRSALEHLPEATEGTRPVRKETLRKMRKLRKRQLYFDAGECE